jgi:EAL domain-containing protein (putative c-di-GMP-specific phosphodiesterase class I)/GGDEF domain-containing protein
MHYIVEYEFAAIFLSLAVIFSFFRRKTVNTRLTNGFLFLIIIVILSAIVNLSAIYVIEHPFDFPLWFAYLTNTLYYFLFMFFPQAFYSCVKCSITSNFTRSKFKVLRYYTPITIQQILILSSPFTHAIFYFDEARVFHKSYAYPTIFIVFGIYFLSAIYKIIIYRKEVTVAQRATVYFYSIACIVAIIIQTIKPPLTVMGFVAAVSTMMLFLSLVNPTNYVDKEMGSLNLKAFRDVADQEIFRGKPFRVIGIQIVGIRFLNETIGLENKAELLKSLYILLQKACGKHRIYRVSGSRMFVIIPDDGEVQQYIVENVHTVFSNSIRMGEFRISLTERIALFRYPDDAGSVHDIEELMHETLVSVIDEEPGTIVKVDKNILVKKNRELAILQVMKKAVRRGDFYVVYQPIYSFESGRFTTAEALVRLENEELGEVSPEEFIPIAERNGMILQIGEFVFETVCRFILHHKIWEKGIEYIHVNLSVIQCMQENLADQLFRIMDLYNLDYRYVNLEVTESAAIASSETLMDNMKRLIERNMKFSLDDFGTGFSNTATLIKYPFHSIKLDKSMVWNAMHNEKAETVLRNTIEMVKLLHMEIVAEGAETPEQIEKLKEMGADYVQGFYYSKPISRDSFIELLNDTQRRK